MLLVAFWKNIISTSRLENSTYINGFNFYKLLPFHTYDFIRLDILYMLSSTVSHFG